MSVLAANSQILWREFHHRDHHHQQQLCASTGNYSFFAGKSGGFWGDFRNREDKKTSKRDVRAEAFWPDLSKPASVVMEPISDCDHLDRILSHAQEISQPILIDWMASWCRKCIYLKPKLEKLAADYDTKTQPENEERDRTASARRRRRFKAAIGVATAAAAYLATDVVRRPMHNSALRGMDKVNELLTNSNENAMFNKVRMGPRAFMILCEMLTDKGLLRPSYNMSVPEQLFVFLTIISQSQSNREAQDVWQHSGETISRRFSEVLNAICALEEEFIKPPNYAKVPKFLRANRQRYGSWFDDCVGALDGTHVPCTPIGVPNPEAYQNRKGVNSLNILAACSFDMKFTYILSGWEGSAHDARVLTDALDNPRSKFQRIPPGKYYLVDAAYANNDQFLAPYRGRTYHLPDYRRRNGGFREPRDIFNYKHSSLRNCIERTFGVWKARFPILRRSNNTYPMDKQVKIPVACAILHNFIHMVNEGDPLLNQYNWDGVPVSEIDPNNEDEFDDDDDDDDNDVNVPEGPVVTAGTVSRTEMGRFRDRLANEMWVDYQRSRGRQV